MAIRLSTAARNFLAAGGSYKDMFQNGCMEIYSGAQPANADAAVTGTLLCTITNNGGTHTAEVLSSGSVTLTGGASGSLDTLTVNSVDILGGAVPYNTSLTQTAADIATQINRHKSSVEYTASSSGAVVTIKAMPGTGTAPNGFVVASTATTLTKTDANMSGGVSAVNGLKFGAAAAGAVAKLASQTWSGTNAATGTAGYYRVRGSIADPGTLDASAAYFREDGSIGASGSGADLTFPSTAFSSAVVTTIDNFDRTMPNAT
jgi:hypothetical protein